MTVFSKGFFSLKSLVYFVENITFRTTLPTSKNRHHHATGEYNKMNISIKIKINK